MPHEPKHLQTLLEQPVPDLPLSFHSMFGSLMAYAEGKPFASLSDAGLALKFSGTDHAAMLALPGAVRLRYAADQPESKTYIVVPDSMLKNAEKLRPWARRSAAGVPAKTARKRAR